MFNLHNEQYKVSYVIIVLLILHKENVNTESYDHLHKIIKKSFISRFESVPKSGSLEGDQYH